MASFLGFFNGLFDTLFFLFLDFLSFFRWLCLFLRFYDALVSAKIIIDFKFSEPKAFLFFLLQNTLNSKCHLLGSLIAIHLRFFYFNIWYVFPVAIGVQEEILVGSIDQMTIKLLLKHHVPAHSLLSFFGHVLLLEFNIRVSLASAGFFLDLATRSFETLPNWVKNPFNSFSSKPIGKCPI